MTLAIHALYAGLIQWRLYNPHVAAIANNAVHYSGIHVDNLSVLFFTEPIITHNILLARAVSIQPLVEVVIGVLVRLLNTEESNERLRSVLFKGFHRGCNVGENRDIVHQDWVFAGALTGTYFIALLTFIAFESCDSICYNRSDGCNVLVIGLFKGVSGRDCNHLEFFCGFFPHLANGVVQQLFLKLVAQIQLVIVAGIQVIEGDDNCRADKVEVMFQDRRNHEFSRLVFHKYLNQLMTSGGH